ncbi:acyl carrier protein [Nocardia sp. NPDC056611]|uniref:acyl carrier protein n=1 Tax=Nocardia sp. NPDC056611 TaxID=3345877 RepID=UPI00366C8685
MRPFAPARQDTVVVDWLTARVAGYLGRSPRDIDPTLPLAELGMDSVSAVSLCGEIEVEWDLAVDPTIVFDYPTILELGGYITGRVAELPGPQA